MNISPFLSGPCSWHWLAPARLRRHAIESQSEWKNYSTAKYSTCSSSPNSCRDRFAEILGEGSLQVEMLSGLHADKWESLGLELANERELRQMRFAETLIQACHLLRCVLPIYGTVIGLCRCLHVLLPGQEDTDVSYSHPDLPFSIFVSCPATNERNRIERLAENIVHEALHLQLSLVERRHSLSCEDTSKQKFFSPWKQSERDLRGFLHGVYVFANLRYFWDQISSAIPKSSTFAQGRTEEITHELGVAAQHASELPPTIFGRKLSSWLSA